MFKEGDAVQINDYGKGFLQPALSANGIKFDIDGTSTVLSVFGDILVVTDDKGAEVMIPESGLTKA